MFSDKAERLLAEAASYGSQLVVFPEAFVGGYPRGSSFGVTIGNRTDKGKEEFRKYHAAAIDVPGKFLFCVRPRQSWLSIVIQYELDRLIYHNFLHSIMTVWGFLRDYCLGRNPCSFLQKMLNVFYES